MVDDFTFQNEGSVVLLRPLTDAAKEWVRKNIHLDNWQNPDRICVEARYFPDLFFGIQVEGFNIRRYGHN